MSRRIVDASITELIKMNRIERGLRHWHEENPMACGLALSTACLVMLAAANTFFPTFPALRALYIFPIWIATRLGRRSVGLVSVGLASIANVFLDQKAGNNVQGVFSGLIWFGVFGVVMLLVAQVEDTLQKSERMAHQDPLTGLYNRRGLELEGHRLVGRAAGEKRDLTVVVIDCDRFKKINDDYGHKAGDETLRFLARTLEVNTRESDIVARLGGDEFVLILADTGESEAERITARIQEAFGRGMAERGFNATLSIGTAEITGDIADLRTLVTKADIAMYQRKEQKSHAAEA
mgnify:CR=1 FL=1